MRVSLSGLFLWCTYLIKPQTGFVPLVLPYSLSSIFTSNFLFCCYYYIIAAYILHYHLCLFYQSPALILLYLEYSLLDITCYIFTCSCMLVLTTRFSMHIYDSNIDTRVFIYARHLALASPLAGSSDSPRSSCPGLETWSLWILPGFSLMLIRNA